MQQRVYATNVVRDDKRVPLETTMKVQDQGKEQDSDGEAVLPAVTANALARWLGVSPKVVYDLAKDGIIERGAGRLFPLEDSVRRYCEHLRRQRP